MDNRWNPFIPTQRDIGRTEELAAKNPIAAGVLSFFFVPAGLIYLNRGVNTLKILGYVFATGFVLGIVSNPNNDNAKNTSNLLGLVGTGAITAEQVMAVNKARQRLKEKPASAPAHSFEMNNTSLSGAETNQEAVQLLKQLKEKFVANEISEEEFKLEKQRILKSL
jgi:hypothetical protein